MAPPRALRAAALGALLHAAAALTRVRLHKTDSIALAGRLFATRAADARDDADQALQLDKPHPVPLSNFMDAQACAAALRRRLQGCSAACATLGAVASRASRRRRDAPAPYRRHRARSSCCDARARALAARVSSPARCSGAVGASASLTP
jgi:hypothetical protein